MERRRSAARRETWQQSGRSATPLVTASWFVLLLSSPTSVGGCSAPSDFDAFTGRDMYAAADLVASGYYSKETVVELKLRANLSGDVLSKVVNSTFEVKDVFASNSSPPGYCFPPTIIIRTTVVDGCVDLLHLWLSNYSYVVAVRALDASAGYYEMREGYQLPFVQSSPLVIAQLRNVSCDYNQTCVAAHPSLCRAARLLPSPPPQDEQPITDAPPPTFAPTNDSDATVQTDGPPDDIIYEEGAGEVTSTAAVPGHSPTAAASSSASATVYATSTAAASAAFTTSASATTGGASATTSASAATTPRAQTSAAAAVTVTRSQATAANRGRVGAAINGGVTVLTTGAFVAVLAFAALLAGAAERTRS